MKKILFIMTAFMVSVFAFANNVDCTMNETKSNSSKEVKATHTELATKEINKSDLELPLTISVPAPHETVIGISGPVRPNHQNWDIQNGMLNIYYTREVEIFDLREGGTFEIQVATSPMMYYVINLIVK